MLLTADRLLALTPRVWAPLGCVYVTTNKLERLKPVTDALALACQEVLSGQVVTVRV